MIGTKRRNVPLKSNAEDAAYQSKRVIVESPFGGGQGTDAFSQGTVAPQLDMGRAESSRQHVRALNTQFASWVQSQLQNHPDELWEDGVRDYLAHASNILEKFSDVVNWLKANAAREGTIVSGIQTAKSVFETKSNDAKSFPQKPIIGTPSTNSGFTGLSSKNLTPAQGTSTSSSSSFSFGLSSSAQALSQSTTASFSTSWSSGMLSNSKAATPGITTGFTPSTSGIFSKTETGSATTGASAAASSFGIFSSSPVQLVGTSPSPSFGTSWSAEGFSNSQTQFKFGGSNDAAKDDADEDNEPEQPSSPSLKRAEEKGVNIVHEVKCKLYVKSTDPADKDPWKDKGTGRLFIKCKEGASKGSKESKPIILVRNDVGRILLNALIYPGIKTNLQKNAIVTIFHTSADSGSEGTTSNVVARTFLIRTRNEEERNKLADAIHDHAPAS